MEVFFFLFSEGTQVAIQVHLVLSKICSKGKIYTVFRNLWYVIFIINGPEFKSKLKARAHLEQ